MIIINEENREFIKMHIPNHEDIFEAATTRDALIVFSTWINRSICCWDDTGRNYSDLGRQAQRVYDDILYDNVYAKKKINGEQAE